MTEIRWYDTASVLQFAEFLGRQLEAATLDRDQLSHNLAWLKFRDDKRRYWTVGPRSLRWYYHDHGSWNHPTSSAPARLEGPAELIGWSKLSNEKRAQQNIPESGRPEPAAGNAPEALRETVHATRQAYERGSITSTIAESLLTEFYLLDNQGRFWTVGVRSEGAYYFERGHWTAAQQLPEPKVLVDQVSDQIEAAAIEFLTSGVDLLPEPMVEAWKPPAGFPEMVRQCPSCAAVDVGDHARCLRCQAELPPPVAAPASPAALCPQCGAPLVVNKKFCGRCGHRLS